MDSGGRGTRIQFGGNRRRGKGTEKGEGQTNITREKGIPEYNSGEIDGEGK